MKAIFFERYGGPEVLQFGEQPTPQPGEGEALIRIRAAGVNPVDWKIRAGYLKDRMPNRFPIVPGWDLAGVVEAVGHAARRFQPGDEVYAYARRTWIQHGAYAEYIALPECYLARKPRGLGFEYAASIPLATLTAYQSIFTAGGLESGQTLLVLGASGGVGGAAVQLAREAGVRVAGLAGARNREYLLGLGAEAALDYAAADWPAHFRTLWPDGADVVFDGVGGALAARAAEFARAGGRVVSILERPPEAALPRGVQWRYVFVEPHAPQLEHFAALIAAGRFRAQVTAVYPLAEAARAHRQIESGHTRGKIVLRVD